jgi:multidrug efflux pump subunit AcrA (membrane-fusion protein)
MLPVGCLSADGATPTVCVVEDSKARRRPIELGLSQGGRVQVIHGLTGNEQVVADGKTVVRDGQAVEVVP